MRINNIKLNALSFKRHDFKKDLANSISKRPLHKKKPHPKDEYKAQYVTSYNANVYSITPYKEKVKEIFLNAGYKKISDEIIKNGFKIYCQDCKGLRAHAADAENYTAKFANVLSSLNYEEPEIDNLEDVLDNYPIISKNDSMNTERCDDFDKNDYDNAIKFSNYMLKNLRKIQQKLKQESPQSNIKAALTEVGQDRYILRDIYITDDKKYSIKISPLDFYRSMFDESIDLSGNYEVFMEDGGDVYGYERHGQIISKTKKGTYKPQSKIALGDIDEYGNPLFNLDENMEHGVLYSIYRIYKIKTATYASYAYLEDFLNVDEIADDEPNLISI